MILTLHLVIGAVIAVKIKFFPLVILFAFLSHYLLDYLPHAEYSIDNIKKRKWKKSRLDFLKLFLDSGVGSTLIVFIHYLTKVNYFILFAAAFFAILPDILIVLNWLYPNNKNLSLLASSSPRRSGRSRTLNIFLAPLGKLLSKILKCHFNFHHKIHFPKDPH